MFLKCFHGWANWPTRPSTRTIEDAENRNGHCRRVRATITSNLDRIQLKMIFKSMKSTVEGRQQLGMQLTTERKNHLKFEITHRGGGMWANKNYDQKWITLWQWSNETLWPIVELGHDAGWCFHILKCVFPKCVI